MLSKLCNNLRSFFTTDTGLLIQLAHTRYPTFSREHFPSLRCMENLSKAHSWQAPQNFTTLSDGCSHLAYAAEPACSQRSNRSRVCKITIKIWPSVSGYEIIHVGKNRWIIMQNDSHHNDNQGYLVYLWHWELKTKFGTIIVMQDRPKGIFFQRLAECSNTDSYLLQWVKAVY